MRERQLAIVQRRHVRLDSPDRKRFRFRGGTGQCARTGAVPKRLSHRWQAGAHGCAGIHRAGAPRWAPSPRSCDRRADSRHLAFRIDRSGRLLDATVAHSTGLPVLDLAALSIVRRASPFPAIPDALREELAITLPTARLAEEASSAISPPRSSSSTDRDHLLQSRAPPSTAPSAVRGCRIRLPSVAA